LPCGTTSRAAQQAQFPLAYDYCSAVRQQATGGTLRRRSLFARTAAHPVAVSLAAGFMTRRWREWYWVFCGRTAPKSTALAGTYFFTGKSKTTCIVSVSNNILPVGFRLTCPPSPTGLCFIPRFKLTRQPCPASLLWGQGGVRLRLFYSPPPSPQLPRHGNSFSTAIFTSVAWSARAHVNSFNKGKPAIFPSVAWSARSPAILHSVAWSARSPGNSFNHVNSFNKDCKGYNLRHVKNPCAKGLAQG